MCSRVASLCSSGVLLNPGTSLSTGKLRICGVSGTFIVAL